MISQTGQIMRTWVSCKPQKTLPAHTHWSTTIPSQKTAVHEGAFMSLFTRQSGKQRVLPVKTHSNYLVVLAHIQLSLFYSLSTRDVTHIRKCTRPSPALPYYKQREAGQGPGNEAKLHQCNTLSTQPRNATCRFS